MIIHFLRPLWLIMLFPAMLYILWSILSTKQNNPWLKVCDPHLLPALLASTQSTKKPWITLNLMMFFLIAIFALAGPSWHKIPSPVYRDVDSLSIVLDLSNAMQEDDLKPNRLMRAKLKIRDLIHLAVNVDMGLVVFSGEGFVVSPLSQDAKTLDVLIDELQPGMMPVSGANLTQGLNEGFNLLNQVNADHGDIILFTATPPDGASITLAKKIAQQGKHLHVLAMLAENAVTQSTIMQLKALAQAGQGSFSLFNADTQDIETFLKNITKHSIQQQTADKATVWQDGGPWCCLLLIPFALIQLSQKRQYEKNY